MLMDTGCRVQRCVFKPMRVTPQNEPTRNLARIKKGAAAVLRPNGRPAD